MKIFKYFVDMMSDPVIVMPDGADILTVSIQNNEMVVWAKVDPSVAYFRAYQFYVVGTGFDVPKDAKYLETVQDDGSVWHIFMEIS